LLVKTAIPCANHTIKRLQFNRNGRDVCVRITTGNNCGAGYEKGRI